MTRTDMLERFQSVLEAMGIHKIVGEDTDLRMELGLESLDFVNLVMNASIIFDVKLSPAETANAETVGEFLSVIETKLPH